MPPSACGKRQRRLADAAQFAVHDLAFDFQPDDEKENRHQAVVDQVIKRMAELERTDLQADRSLPESQKVLRYRGVGQRIATIAEISSTTPPIASTCMNRETGLMMRSIGRGGRKLPLSS